MSSILRKCARRAETMLEFIPDNEKYLILKDGERYSRVAVRNLCKKKDPDMTLVIRKGLISVIIFEIKFSFRINWSKMKATNLWIRQSRW